MDAKELKKWLTRQGCVFEGKRDGSGHLVVINPKTGRRSELPVHSRWELGTGVGADDQEATRSGGSLNVNAAIPGRGGE
jgi:predicted RNA binding protein YcfA (HicA-like mRNA interferase family)